MECASPLTLITPVNASKLQEIQYQSLKLIYKASTKASSTELHSKAKLATMLTRLTNLSEKYPIKAHNTNNQLFANLIDNHATKQDDSPTVLTLWESAIYRPSLLLITRKCYNLWRVRAVLLVYPSIFA